MDSDKKINPLTESDAGLLEFIQSDKPERQHGGTLSF